MWRFPIALAIAGVAVLGLAWLRPPASRARFLRLAGLGLMAGFTLVGAGWVVAETVDDPGGWPAVGLIASWLVPLAILVAISWSPTRWATVLLSALTAGMVGLGVWFAADPGGWRAFEDDNGPVRAIGVLVLAAPIALLGWRRPLPAGVLLLVLGLAPVVLSAAGTSRGLGSLVAVSSPAVVAGVLYLLAAAAAGQTPATTVTPPAGAVRPENPSPTALA